eukprot:1042487-Prorocentrum_minimum.AAC.2
MVIDGNRCDETDPVPWSRRPLRAVQPALQSVVGTEAPGRCLYLTTLPFCGGCDRFEAGLASRTCKRRWS